MPILYLLNYIELSYSEITFAYWTFNSESSVLPNLFQIDKIDEFAENLCYMNKSVFDTWLFNVPFIQCSILQSSNLQVVMLDKLSRYSFQKILKNTLQINLFPHMWLMMILSGGMWRECSAGFSWCVRARVLHKTGRALRNCVVKQRRFSPYTCHKDVLFLKNFPEEEMWGG